MPVPNPDMRRKVPHTTRGFIRGAVTLMRIRFQTLMVASGKVKDRTALPTDR